MVEECLILLFFYPSYIIKLQFGIKNYIKTPYVKSMGEIKTEALYCSSQTNIHKAFSLDSKIEKKRDIDKEKSFVGFQRLVFIPEPTACISLKPYKTREPKLKPRETLWNDAVSYPFIQMIQQVYKI